VSLLDTIRQGLRAKEEPQALGTTEKIRGIRRAATGRAVSPRGPEVTTQAERQVQADIRRGLERQREAGELAAEEMEQRREGLAQREQQAEAAARMQRAEMQSQFANQAADVLGDLSRGRRELTLETQKDKLEQAGFLASFADRQYLHNLQLEGQRRRLSSDLEFQQALKRSIFASEMELMERDIDFREIMDARGRDFQRKLADIDIDTALRIASAEAQADEITARWSGVGTIAQGVVTAMEEKSPRQPPKKSPRQSDISA